MALDSARQIAVDAVELPADTPPDEALGLIEGAGRVDVRFDTFKDGRGFSLAAVLRERGYDGELNAVGPLLPDQETALKRVGFDAVIPTRSAETGPARRGAFPHVYQPGPGRADGVPAYRRRALEARRARAEGLANELDGASPEQILSRALEVYAGRIAQLSSFGAEAALGLALLADADPDTPVLFLDTHRHFPQTLQYRDRLAASLGLTRLQILEPDAAEAEAEDADGRLYERDGPACCELRKVRPLARALAPFDAVITGRKRYHGGERGRLEAVEFDGERVKINPLAFLSPDEVTARFRALELAPHPLVEHGYASIGCWPCTAPVDDPGSRAGRWAGQDRDECGIFDPALARRAERAASVRLI